MSELRRAHVHLMDIENELVLYFNNSGGHYMENLGYQAMIFDG
jgi:hypothetical protein